MCFRVQTFAALKHRLLVSGGKQGAQGAITSAFDRALRALDKQSRLKTSTDSTIYGTARTSHRRFYAHHLTAHSFAVVVADATTVHTAATELTYRLSIGLHG